MIDVDDRDALILKIDRFLQEGAFEEALDLATERLRIHPDDLEAVIVICQSWLGLHNLAEAENALAGLERATFRMASLYKCFGDACLKEDRRRDAVAYFQKGLALMPEAFTHRQLSQIMSDAVGTLKESASIHETGPEEPAMEADFYTMTMADLYVKQGHLQSAVDVLEAIQRREPDNTSVIRRLRDVKALMADQSPAPSGTGPSAVVSELSRWLENIDKIKRHDRSDHLPD